jgi:2-amino-4-hydroxy-6-hydroxymethyldihydropteridine diphosphokinase
MTLAGVAIGANLGDRRATVMWAIEQLALVLDDIRVSRVIETEPVEVQEPQPPYFNAVVVGDTNLSVDALFERLRTLEQQRGRTRLTYHAARTLDLDLLFYGTLVLDVPGLTVPHPRFRQRRFVLEPLAEVAPDWVDPVTGQRAAALLAALVAKEKGA